MPSILTYPTSLTPFIERDDATRIQMAANQMIQTLPILNPDIPFIQTGNEQLFTLSNFSVISEEEGKILDVTLYSLIVHYYRSDRVKIYDINWRYKLLYEIGEEFPENAVLATDITVDNSNLVFGKNLLTITAPFYGYNYEDAIVVNERLVTEKCFHSVHSQLITLHVSQNEILLSLDDGCYQPLPVLKKMWPVDKPYAIKKSLNLSNIESLFIEPENKYFEYDCVFYDIRLFPNSWNRVDREWDLYIQNYLETMDKKAKETLEKYKSIVDEEELLRFIYRNGLDVGNFVNTKTGVGKFISKTGKFSGTLIKLYAVFTAKLQIGDKLANRHGNKGVISRILPENKMPKLDDGRVVDIIINPLGVPSRMNVGQLFELALGETVYQFRKQLQDLYEKGEYRQILEKITKLVTILDNTKNNWYSEETQYWLDKIQEFDEELFLDELKDIIDNFYILEPPFESSSNDQIYKAFDFVGSRQTAKVFDPISGKYLLDAVNKNNEITYGYMYWTKLVHVAWAKYAARSVGSYSSKMMQPLGGRKNRGGQRFGEMETWCLISYNALKNLEEMLTLKSDSVTKKYKYVDKLVNQLLVGQSKLIGDDSPESLRLLKMYLNQIGLDINMLD